MNHPIVKKLLGNELLLWCVGSLVVVLLPLGVVVMEATTHTRSSKCTSDNKATGKTKSKAVVTKTRKADGEQSGGGVSLFEQDAAAEITDGVLDPDSIFGSRPAEPATTWHGTGSTIAGSGSDTLLAEAASDSIGVGIQYYGGISSDGSATLASGAGIAAAEIVVVDSLDAKPGEAAVELSLDGRGGRTGVGSSESFAGDSAAASTEGATSAGRQGTPAVPEQMDPDLVALLSGGTGTSVEKTKHPDAVDKPSNMPDEVVVDDRERTEVTLIRPTGDVVKSIDEIIVRCRTKPTMRPYVLVRSSQHAAPWWVQRDTMRQGMYVRGRIQCGNQNTVNGSVFSVVVAFVDSLESVPQAGMQMMEIPQDVLLSQELKFTVRK